MRPRILIAVLFVVFVATSAYAQMETIKTRIGKLSFTRAPPARAPPRSHQKRAYTSPIWYTA